MATLIVLCESGLLETIDPLEEDELGWRTLYATPKFISWLDHVLPELGHNVLYSDLSPIEQVFAAFAEYCSGENMLDDKRFKKLRCSPEHFVWEIKTEEVRIFGWIPRKDAFVCCFGESKDQIMLLDSYGRYLAQTVYFRTQLDLDSPKCLEEGEIENVISTKS